MAIPQWNAKHFLVTMLNEFVTRRENYYYKTTLQLAHKDCNWCFVEDDVRYLRAYGTSLEKINDWSWYEVMCDPNLHYDFVVKHHRECLDVQAREGEHEELIFKQLQAGNKNIRTISYGEEDLIHRPETQIETVMSEIQRYADDFEQCDTCGYGQSKRTGICSACVRDRERQNA